MGSKHQKSQTHSKGGRFPTWNQTLTFTYDNEKTIQFKVIDKDMIGSDYIGCHDLHLGPIVQGSRAFEGELPLSRKKGKSAGYIDVSISFYGEVGEASEPPKHPEKEKDKEKRKHSKHSVPPVVVQPVAPYQPAPAYPPQPQYPHAAPGPYPYPQQPPPYQPPYQPPPYQPPPYQQPPYQPPPYQQPPPGRPFGGGVQVVIGGPPPGAQPPPGMPPYAPHGMPMHPGMAPPAHIIKPHKHKKKHKKKHRRRSSSSSSSSSSD
eukprot:CAMPEP_0113846316 /NCGR_PEP_ID=MMETSP0372-20130328/1242_1 /TAXON_ID=340204 /ORGANISM="Lankesteria abbotti" /LENGTH=261 /DNA_ID=CAMNT_0000815451 /DNA_START=147 /DNA_END=932 /DNA_ORIENTATION=- /assembly_acc=CAM_ASM_000359